MLASLPHSSLSTEHKLPLSVIIWAEGGVASLKHIKFHLQQGGALNEVFNE